MYHTWIFNANLIPLEEIYVMYLKIAKSILEPIFLPAMACLSSVYQ